MAIVIGGQLHAGRLAFIGRHQRLSKDEGITTKAENSGLLLLLLAHLPRLPLCAKAYLGR